MARAISGNIRLYMPDMTPPQEATVPGIKTYLVPAKGMDTGARLNMMEPAVARLVENLMFRDNAYQTRFGTSVIGTAAGSQVVYATEFFLSNGDSYLIRWKETGVDYLVAGDWRPILGAPPSASTELSISATGWNDTLVYTSQSGKIQSISFVTGVPTVSEIFESPYNSIHLATWAGRIIASIRGTVIAWCQKNDNTQWELTDLGAGQEDLLSAPGGIVDSQIAVIPLTDENAYAIRSNSLWLITQTGNFDAPFRFNRLYQGVGASWPLAVTSTRNGAAFLSHDDVIIANLVDGLRSVGKQIRRSIIGLERKYLRRACIAYDGRENELRLSIPDGNAAGHKIWRYSINSDLWTVDRYQFESRAISFSRYNQSGLVIDDLPGFIDSLPGVIDDLGITDRTTGLIFTVADDGKRVNREDETRLKDVDSASLDVDRGWRVETSYVYGGPSLKKTSLVEVFIEYESEGPGIILMEYSDDGGNNWNYYDEFTVANTQGRPEVMSFTGTFERNHIQVAASCQDTPNMRILALHARTAEGAMITDAS